MKRIQWQQLAECRILDAEALLASHRWNAAYYLVGYAVEAALKSCILKRLATAVETIFEDRRFSEKCWTHDLKELLKLAGLELAVRTDASQNGHLEKNWEVVYDWSERSRYNSITHWQAKKLYRAIADEANGVMKWTKAHW